MRQNSLSTFSFLIAIAAMLTFGFRSAAQQRSPLVIGIMVEGLTDSDLDLLEPHFGEGGFKKLLTGGARISNLDYGPNIDPTAAAAVIMTGASPNVNGIASSTIYNPATDRSLPTLTDTKHMGNFTDETLSPSAIKVSTLADELRMATDGDATVYAIAADPQQSIISAGHAGNAAFWIYDHTGNWASSTFYKDMPSAVSNRNYKMPLRTRLDTMVWTPMRPLESYPMLSRQERLKPFRNTYPAKQFDRIIRFKSTPLANREITDLAIDLMSSAKMGTDDAPDMILISYNLNHPGASRAETIDLYLRLDRDLARLFSEASKVSRGAAPTIFLIGLPAQNLSRADDRKWRVPTGEYSIRKALSLLEMYLIGVHGNGDWVTGYHNRNFYLNRKLIADKNLNLTTFRTEAADFLARMAGVSNVFTIDDIIAARVGDDPQGLKRNTSVEHAGDLIVEINPGWVIVDDPSSKTSVPTARRMSAENIPALIMAPSVRPHRIDTTVDARAISPALARIMRLRAPNAAADGSLKL